MIDFFKNQERLKNSLIILGIYFLTSIIWKQLFGVFHYILPFLGSIGVIYSSITGWISFLLAYFIVIYFTKHQHCKVSQIIFISLIMRIILSFIPMSTYIYPIVMVYPFDFIHSKTAF